MEFFPLFVIHRKEDNIDDILSIYCDHMGDAFDSDYIDSWLDHFFENLYKKYVEINSGEEGITEKYTKEELKFYGYYEFFSECCDFMRLYEGSYAEKAKYYLENNESAFIPAATEMVKAYSNGGSIDSQMEYWEIEKTTPFSDVFISQEEKCKVKRAWDVVVENQSLKEGEKIDYTYLETDDYTGINRRGLVERLLEKYKTKENFLNIKSFMKSEYAEDFLSYYRYAFIYNYIWYDVEDDGTLYDQINGIEYKKGIEEIIQKVYDGEEQMYVTYVKCGM